MLRRLILLQFYLIVTVMFASSNSERVVGADQSFNVLSDKIVLYLPIIQAPDPFIYRTQPIWSNTDLLSNHEVNLFRKQFNLSDPAFETKLYIFADTRYELWIDGEWIGRGPARFSLNYHEYDIYALGDLDPGVHSIAVLVQWAPNTRRSESTTAYLQSYLEESINGNVKVLASTGQDWKVFLSPAWRTNSAPVHSWRTIGPTELMDLRQYPPDWMLKGYDDSSWAHSVIKDPNRVDIQSYFLENLLSYDKSSLDLPNASRMQYFFGPALYGPRTISNLIEVEFPYSVLDVGLISPGRRIIDFIPSPDYNGTFSIDLSVEANTDLTMERLSGEVENPAPLLSVDGQEITWADSPAMRPDVQIAQVNISPGNHQLIFDDYPDDGVRLSLSTDNINWENIPFEQGINAGKRLLLAEYSSLDEMLSAAKFDTIAINQLPAYLVLDVGRVVHGRLVLDILGPKGTVVDIGWDERLYKNTTRPLPFPGTLHPQWNQTDSWILDGNKHTIKTIDTRTGRYILLAFWGDAPVTLGNIHVMEERYPVVQQGFFESSDELLNEIWQVGVDTVYPNMTDAYTDTPWRERGQWWGDAYVIDRVNRVVFGDFALLKRGLFYMGNAFENGMPQAIVPNGAGAHMMDYGMLWVYLLQEYLQLTNDHAFVQSQYSTILEFMSYLESHENSMTGLLDFHDDGSGWATTVYLDTFAWFARMGQSVPANAMYVETLFRAALIAEELGDFKQANQFRVTAEEKKRQLNSNFYLPQQGRYITSIDQETVIPPSIYSQIWPLAHDVVPFENVDEVFNSTQDFLPTIPENANMGIYAFNWILDAYGKNGFISEAIDLIKNYYGWMLSQGATTWWEVFNSKENYKSSLSHGWGSSPTWFLTTYLLGAQQTGPKEWQIKPSFAVVDYVSGGIPLGEDELLSVHWEKKSCKLSRVFIHIPEDTTGSVVLPVFQNTTLVWDGRLVWENHLSHDDRIEIMDSELLITVAEGDHQFEINHDCE